LTIDEGQEAGRQSADPVDGGVSRRQLLQGAGATAAALAVSQAGIPAGKAAPPFRPRGKLKRRPNFLVILADEYRYPPVYESAATQEYRAANYVAEEALREDGLEFENHYIMSSACAPSRTSFFTGQYPSLHGVTQTDGVAKNAVEDTVFWLDPDTIPTMGDYFRMGGYRTYYKGKWHLSHADIDIPGTYNQLVSFTADGERDREKERTYLKANRLDGFGFDGWIGPEPHGANPLNSGSSASAGGGRDAQFAAQTVELLRQLGRKAPGDPWLLVSSFVNPHDIAVWGDVTLRQQQWNLSGQLQGSKVPQQPFDPQMYAATSGESLRGKPQAQASYVETYPQMLQPTTNDSDYQRFYYQLQENVNREIKKVLDALNSDPRLAAETIVIFTSDHGTLLGAHGGMFQKWHQAYEETSHVPFLVHNPTLFSGRQSVDTLTSHADVIPTMLGLAGLDAERLRKKLARTHDEAHPLAGRDLSALLLGERPPASFNEPVYFMTDDEVSRGGQQVSFQKRMYESVLQPNHVETVVANYPTGPGGGPEKWKYTRYFDTPQFWSNPPDEPPPENLPPEVSLGDRDVVTLVDGNVERAGPKKARTTVKRKAVADEEEIYNLSRDPLELDNLAKSSNAAVAQTVAQLRVLLGHERKGKRRVPTSGHVPGQAHS
jgi:arylsulfatase A-like enzyme